MSVRLRVFAGANAGAELALTEGDWLVGTDSEADLTLAEPALARRQLRLTVGAGGVTLLALAPGAALWDQAVAEGEPVALEEGVPVAIGATRFVLGDGPLRDPPPPPAPPPEPAAPPPSATPARGQWRRLSVLAACGMLLAVAVPVGGAVWLLGDAPAPPPPSHSAMLDEANAVIGRLGLADRVGARIEGTRLVIAGQIENTARLDDLAGALHGAGLPAELAVTTDTDMIDMVATVMRAFAIGATVAVTGPGRVQLEGFVATDEGRIEAALRRLRSDIPSLLAVEDQLATPDRIRAFLESELRSAGLAGKVRVTGVQQATVLVGGAIDGPDIEAWSALARRFQTRFPPPVRLDGHLASVARAAPRGVSLGRSPFVLFEDGQRLTIGGSYGMGTVVGISADGLRLRIASGEIIVPFAQTPRWVMEEIDGPKR